MQHQLFDKLVYSKVRAAMGGRVRHAMSGGSAMDRRLGLFFAGAGVQIYEGYGLTESTAAATANPPERTRYGTVGQPIPGTTVHIADDGEIWLSGPNVFQGYLNDPKATDATLHDGWLATGDLGSLDEDGYLTITGRKKEILVTSGGKSVSPGILEERVRDHPLVAQCIVVGNDRPYIAALVTLDQRPSSTGSPCGTSQAESRRSWSGTPTWRPRCGAPWSPRTPSSPRPSRSARSGYWPISSPRSTVC
jgi:long-chain acyl-CoA synthetase